MTRADIPQLLWVITGTGQGLAIRTEGDQIQPVCLCSEILVAAGIP